MHRVVHDQISKDGNYQYIGEKITNWIPSSNLLQLVRRMHQEFELNPPIPENLVQNNGSAVSAASEQPQINPAQNDEEIEVQEEQEKPQEEELVKPEIRTEQERVEAAEKDVDDRTSQLLNQSKEQIISSLQSISLTELQKLADDEEYQEDTRTTSTNYVRVCKAKDNIEDQALKTATENIRGAEDLEGDIQIYTETVHPLYLEQSQKAQALCQQIEQRQGQFNRQTASKVLKTLSNEKYKDGEQTKKQFNKGQTSKEDFIDQFIKSRKEFYMLQTYNEILV